MMNMTIRIIRIEREVLSAAMLRQMRLKSTQAFMAEIPKLIKTDKGKRILELMERPEEWELSEA